MFIFLDTETTGTGPDDRLCQIAFRPENGPAVCGMFNPGKLISIDAMVIHHITNKMIQGKPSFQGSEAYRQLQTMVTREDSVIVAHNAAFDVQMLKMEGIHPPRAICTLKLARHLDKNGVIPRYGLQYLRYFLELDVDARAHDALGDLLVLEKLFDRLNKKFQEDPKLEDPVQGMIRISSGPVLIPRISFGKHKGILFSEVPKDYLEWLLTTELDEDLAYTVKTHLGISVSR